MAEKGHNINTRRFSLKNLRASYFLQNLHAPFLFRKFARVVFSLSKIYARHISFKICTRRFYFENLHASYFLFQNLHASFFLQKFTRVIFFQNLHAPFLFRKYIRVVFCLIFTHGIYRYLLKLVI